MKILFYKVAKAYSIKYYNEAMDDLEKANHVVATAFKVSNLKVFYRAFIKIHAKADVIMNNLAQTFNGYIINARTKHLIYMLEDIITTLMQRLMLKRQEMEKRSVMVCLKIQVKLEIEKEYVANCFPIPSTNLIFQVNHKMDNLIIDLDSRSCNCRKWDLCGIPCCHAFSCIFSIRKNVEDFVDDCYKREPYLRAYARFIPPCVSERHWLMIEQQLDPPLLRLS